MKSNSDSVRFRMKPIHIEEGVRFNCHKCPVALTIAEQSGLYCKINTSFIYCGTFKTKTPAKVRKFMGDFDDGIEANPITFDLPSSFIAEARTRGSQVMPYAVQVIPND